MKLVLAILGALLGIVLIMFVVGLLLPRDHTARMTIRLNAAPERVWALVSNIEDTPRWRADVERIEMQPDSGGAGRFVEHSSQGSIPFQVVSREAPARQVIRIVDADQPFGGTWTWVLDPDGTGTRLTITEEGFIKNPLFRVMGALFFKPTATMDAYLRSLATELGESALPAEVANGP